MFLLKWLKPQIFFCPDGAGEGGSASANGTVDNANINISAENGGNDDGNQSKQGLSDGDNGGESTSTEDLDKEFQDLMKTKYKKQYENAIKSTLDKRLKNAKANEEKLSLTKNVFEQLAKKYGVKDANDYNAISQAFMSDDALYEEEADQLGLPVETYKKMKQTEQKLADYESKAEEERKQQETQRIYNEWMQQAENVKAIYPSFDLETETQNPDFMQFMQMPGMDVKSAFEHAHMTDIMNSVIKASTEKAKSDVSNVIASNRNRPVESPKANPSYSQKVDPSKLTSQQIREYINRAENGEVIDFVNKY